jgi:hypothetical protein
MAVTGALALSLFAASAVSADDGSYVDDGDSGFTLDLDIFIDLSGDFLGIRWY